MIRLKLIRNISRFGLEVILYEVQHWGVERFVISETMRLKRFRIAGRDCSTNMLVNRAGQDIGKVGPCKARHRKFERVG